MSLTTAAALGVAGCAAAQPSLPSWADKAGVSAVSKAAASVARPVIDGQQATVLVPRHTNGVLVLFNHGAGRDSREIQAEPGTWTLGQRLVAAGYTIAGSDAHGDNWGSSASMADYVALASYATETYKTTSTVILSASMGALDGLPLIPKVHAKAWAGIYPLCNAPAAVAASGAVGRAIQASGVQIPLGLSLPEPTVLKALPMAWWASPQDVTVPKTTNTDLCAAVARADGAKVTVISVHGPHGDPSHDQPTTLARFYAAAIDH